MPCPSGRIGRRHIELPCNRQKRSITGKFFYLALAIHFHITVRASPVSWHSASDASLLIRCDSRDTQEHDKFLSIADRCRIGNANRTLLADERRYYVSELNGR